MTDSSMLKYQYDTILDQLILLQLHAESPDCPCSLQGTRPGELGEFCEPKHLRSIVALARETIAMEEDEARLDYLENLVLEGSELLGKMSDKLCDKEVDLGDYVTWSRDKRKPLEGFCYSGFCAIPQEEAAMVEELARMFRKKTEPRWCYPVKETDKELGKLSRTLGTAKKRIAEIQRQLEMPLNICRGQAELFESTTGVLDPYGSRCRDPKTGQWMYSEDCGFEPAGITTTALGMDGLTRYEFEFKVVSLDKLIVSHDPFTFAPNPNYPEELQPRLRGRAATKIQVEKIAANLEPDAVITDFHVIDRGTPIVGPDLVVEAGNGRVMGIIKAAADHPDKYAEYKDRLRERARDYGLSAKDVDLIENPVLIRVRITDVDRTTFAQEANQAATIAPSAIEIARTDAHKITLGMLRELIIGENESLEDALRAPKNQAFAKRFLATLPENVQAALVDAQGYLNRDGVHRMAMAVFVSAFQGDSGLRLAEKAFESVDMDVRNTVNAIARSLGPLAQAEALTRTGERDTTLSIGDDLAQTVNVYSAIKRNPSLTVEKYMAQEQIFARELTPFQEKILVVLEEYKRSPRKLAGIFTAYAEGVIKAPPPAQAALLPGAEITKEGLWESAVKAPEAQPALMEVIRMFEEGTADLSMPAPFGWVGGKKLLSKKIVNLIPPHKTYVEPFCGAASVFWAKEPSRIEVLNDLDPDLMRFYRDVGGIDKCNTAQLSKNWDRLKAREGKLGACEFLSAVLCSYGSLRDVLDFAGTHKKACTNNAPSFHNHLPQYQARLKNTKLYNEDWQKVVSQYDSPDTFFYFDPPYHATIRGYKYSDDQLAGLADNLPTLKGKWLLSYDDHPDVRQAFKDYHILPVISRYTLLTKYDGKGTKGMQLLIANYPIEGEFNEGDEVARMFEKKLPSYIIKHCETEARNVCQGRKGQSACYQETLNTCLKYARIGWRLSRYGKESWYPLESPMMLLTKEIRAKLPPLYSQEKVKDPMVWVKFFTPDSNWTWYATEYSPEEQIFFGWVVGFEKELGYFSLKELESARGPLGLAIERDKWFKPMPLSEVKKLHQHERGELSQGTMGAIGASVITGIGIGTGFKIIDEVTKLFKVKEAEMKGEEIKKLDWRDFSQAKQIYDLAVRQKEEGREYDEPIEKYPGVDGLSPVDQAIYYAGLYARHKPTDKTFGYTYAELMRVYIDLAKAIEVDLYGREEAASEFRDVAFESDKYPYAQQIPAYVDVFKTTIAKHYRPTEDFHDGSIRAVKPEKAVLVYLGCLKSDDWDAGAERCSPNPTALKTIVPNNKKYRDELDHLKLVHPEVKINYQTKEVGVEPALSEEEQEELEAVDRALDNAEVI